MSGCSNLNGISPDRSKGDAFGQDRPDCARHLVGQRHNNHVEMPPLQ
jgi:hypothetical protein